MAESIYLLGEDGTLRDMQEQPYANEDLLQTLVENHPELLAGDQMNPSSPRRWLLINREMAIPDDVDASGRWSLDHLFVDQDGIPTLVEVKRSSDTRLRREVVGQMLDYAANGVVFWPIEVIRDAFEKSCESRNEDANEVLIRHFGQDGDETADSFWETVNGNLRSGNLRLVFLADVIPTELQRVVEFLNEQMKSVDVVAVELKQFVGEGIRTLVPRLIGQTAIAKQKQAARERRQWDEESFLTDLTNRKGKEAASIIKRIIDWMVQHTEKLDWGTGKDYTGVKGILKHNGRQIRPFLFYSNGVNCVAFETLAKWTSFADNNKRLELMEKLNAINGINIPEQELNKWPSFPLMALNNDDALNRFLGVFEWVLNEIRNDAQNGDTSSN